MASNSITIKLGKGLKNISSDIVWDITKIGLFNTSEDAIKKAQEKAPYDTGTLKKSIWRFPANITTRTRKVNVWPREVVYAERREYENNKNPDRKFYMKRTGKEIPSIAKEEFEGAVKIVLKRKNLI